jgi:hypothetical protein
VELAAGVDRDADRDLGADGLEVVVAELGAQHEVARAGADRLRLALDMPVDLALHHHPPLVVLVVVRVVGRARRVQDDERLDVVAEDQRRGPWAILGRMAGQELVEVRV